MRKRKEVQEVSRSIAVKRNNDLISRSLFCSHASRREFVVSKNFRYTCRVEILKKESFLKIYADLPISVRQEIILVLNDGRTLSWNAAFFEVRADTPLADEILDKLEKLQII